MLHHLLFITFRWLDFIDILMVAIIMFQLYKLVKGTVAIRIFLGILAVYLFWKIVSALQMELLSEILGQFIGVGVLALIIVFQQEIRRFLLMIGNNRFFSNGKNGSFLRLLSFGETKNKLNIAQIIIAVTNLSKTKTGALIVLDLNSELKFYTASGEKLSSAISAALLESIFFKNSPLHDGGVIIENNRITAARCILPVSDNQEFPDHFGLRHRAAAGITENSQSFSIIISEETGKISTAKAGKISYNISIEELNEKLKAEVK
ncbi:MAG: TIGR00159 family protein [Flavobacteriales bacterium CG_4_10_14_0_2_um_filter_32_8]|nr:MAG: TIGR00159 family protein [Flavobacteriales bacterium CG_4_10_14_0_2_um_filter_32_8]PJB14149.1 MAG: TIGR00159 family protein [Flavobacteriales bacterium CG_4_9_14_3_um_filter_32_8]